MLTFTYSSICCALVEVNGIAGYRGKARAMLKDFCLEIFKAPSKLCGPSGRKPYLRSYYIFLAKVRDAASAYPYGPEIISFLQSQDVGTVTVANETWNPFYEPDHIVQAFIFNPDPVKLEKWWTENKDK